MNRGAGVVVGAIVAVVLLPIALLVGVVTLSEEPAAACTASAGAGPTVSLTSLPAVDGYDAVQVTNAAQIMNAASSLGLSVAAQKVGVMTAIGESRLRVLGFGDVAGPDSRGLFQQRDSWGPLAVRMDPTGSALLFFNRLKAVNGWESMSPSFAAHTVQVNGDITLSDGSVLQAQEYYTQFYADASRIVEALGGGAAGGACVGVSGDAVQLAQQIMAAHEQGRFVTLSGPGQPDHLPEIAAIAAGTSKQGCGIDVGILQVMVAALQNFDSVGVSDINRACTGQLEGAGAMSSHNVDGGGHAVDFYMLNGAAITGCDASSLRLLSILDAMMPKGSRAGQVQCRSTTFVNLTQFNDTPNHLHIDNAYAVRTG